MIEEAEMIGDPKRYFNIQRRVDETQDRPSIASRSGFANVSDMTGITREGDYTNMESPIDQVQRYSQEE